MSNKDNIQAAAEYPFLKLVKKYERYISNLKYAIDLNGHGDEVNARHQQRMDDYSEVVKDLALSNIAYQRIIGEFIGFLDGLLVYDIPEEVKANMSAKIAELELDTN